MGTPRVEDLWDKDAYDTAGTFLGRIEAVAMGRDRVPRRVGVLAAGARAGAGALTFYPVSAVTVAAGRVIISLRSSLRVLPE